MQEDSDLLNPLYQSIEEYGKTSITLLKLKTLEKVANLLANYAAKATVVVVFLLVFVFLSLALSLWLGELLGKLYYGFIILATFYAFVGIILQLFLKQSISNQIKNSMVSEVLKSPL